MKPKTETDKLKIEKQVKKWIDNPEVKKSIENAYYRMSAKNAFREGYKQAQTQTRLADLKDELEFLVNLPIRYLSSGIIQERISQIQQEIKEIENGK